MVKKTADKILFIMTSGGETPRRKEKTFVGAFRLQMKGERLNS